MLYVKGPAFQPHHAVITDPLFYLLAIPAVILLGLSKGGFAGLGMVTTPMLALIMPPLQAAAILLPLLIIQDAISVWTYRHAWSAWNLKVLMPGAALGMGTGALFAGIVSNATIELTVNAMPVNRPTSPTMNVDPAPTNSNARRNCESRNGGRNTQERASPPRMTVVPRSSKKPTKGA